MLAITNKLTVAENADQGLQTRIACLSQIDEVCATGKKETLLAALQVQKPLQQEAVGGLDQD